MRKIVIGTLALAVVVAIGLFGGFAIKSNAVEANGIQPAASGEMKAAEVSTAEPLASKTYAMGNPNAPVKIKEFASLSCPHCADFHKNILPEVKKNLIDTGKVYFEFINFPLNASAMNGAVVALCMPEDRYNQFITFLFDNQTSWAFNEDHSKFLLQNAKLLGASEEKLNDCLNNGKIKQGIVANMQAAQEKYHIESTPSFVINETETFSGTTSFDDFNKKVSEYLPKEKSSE